MNSHQQIVAAWKRLRSFGLPELEIQKIADQLVNAGFMMAVDEYTRQEKYMEAKLANRAVV